MSFDHTLIERAKQESKMFELLGIQYQIEEDKKRIAKVIEIMNAKKISATAAVPARNVMSLISTSLQDFCVIGDINIITKVNSAIQVLPFYPMTEEPAEYKCYVTYNLDDETKEVDEKSGKAEHIKIPRQPDKRSHIFLAHEFAHLLKETNYEEYKLFLRFSDVIPIFLELISSEKATKDDRKYTIRKRIEFTLREIKTYQAANEDMEPENAESLRVIANRSGQYINSFYYALLLYKKYKKHPKEILASVHKVLNHEITTEELLIDLDLIKDNTETFKEEFKSLAKRI